MKEKYKSIVDLFGKDYDYIYDKNKYNYTKNDYDEWKKILDYQIEVKTQDYDEWKKILDYQIEVKTQEEIWQEQLEKMDISVVEKFLRKKKLERINNEE